MCTGQLLQYQEYRLASHLKCWWEYVHGAMLMHRYMYRHGMRGQVCVSVHGVGVRDVRARGITVCVCTWCGVCVQ